MPVRPVFVTGRRLAGPGVGEFVSLLSGPCGEVDPIAPDQLPRGLTEMLNRLVCVHRERFVGFLLRKVRIARLASATSRVRAC